MHSNIVVHALGLLILGCVFSCGESGKAVVVTITDQNWRQTLEGEWLIKFFAPWCPACKAVAPTWKELADWSQELNTNIAEVDVTEEPGLSGRFVVTSLPTIYHAKDGVFRRYLGPRTKDELITLIEEQKYLEIDPVSSWQSPNSIPMTVMSWVFKMSMLVRITHTILTEDYGFPAWSSYGFFAVITVMLGLFLGMILVVIADCIWPVNPRSKPPPTAPPQPQGDGRMEQKKKEGEEEEEEEQKEGGVSEESTGEGGRENVKADQTVRKRKTEPDATQAEEQT